MDTSVFKNDNADEFHLEVKVGNMPVMITSETTFACDKNVVDIFALRNMLYYILDHAAADMVKKPSKDYLIEVISRGLLQVIRDNEAVVDWINDIHNRGKCSPVLPEGMDEPVPEVVKEPVQLDLFPETLKPIRDFNI